MPSLKEKAREFRKEAHKRDLLPSPYWSDEDAAAFARQVAREERKRCAKACEHIASVTCDPDSEETAKECAIDIRSLEDL